MIIDSCSWDSPGIDPYRNDARGVSAWVAQVPEGVLPSAAKAELLADIAAGRRTGALYVTRDTVTSATAPFSDLQAYEPDLSYMSFGTKGRVCRTVTRTKWDADRIEGGRLYCTASGLYCVAEMAICGNWVVVRRQPGSRGLVLLPPWGPGYGQGETIDSVGPIPLAPVPATTGVPAVFVAAPGAPGSPGGSFGGFGGGGGGYGASSYVGGDTFITVVSECCDCEENGHKTIPPGFGAVTPVPEPGTYALMLAGLVVVASLAKRRLK